MIYGKPVRYAEEMLTDALEDEHISFSKTFPTCPLIGELYSTIKRAKAKVRREGGAMSAYGWMPLGDTDIDSFISYIIQSYELFLIAACYGEAMVADRTRTKSKQFKIMVHQHDGVSIALGEEADRDAVIAGLKAAVKFAGEEVGIVAMLVEDDAEVKPEVEQKVLVAA